MDGVWGDLPAPWKATVDVSSGKTYYYNPETNVTTWTHPVPQPSSQAPQQRAQQESLTLRGMELDREAMASRSALNDYEHEVSGAIAAAKAAAFSKVAALSAESAAAASTDTIVDINEPVSCPQAARLSLTRKPTLDRIEASSGAVLMVKGVFHAPGAAANADPASHLHISVSGPTAEAVSKAVALIEAEKAKFVKVTMAASPFSVPQLPQHAAASHAPLPIAGLHGHPSPLPPGWVAHVDPTSKKEYYHNAASGTTSWDRPDKAALSTISEQEPSPSLQRPTSMTVDINEPVSCPQAARRSLTRKSTLDRIEESSGAVLLVKGVYQDALGLLANPDPASHLHISV